MPKSHSEQNTHTAAERDTHTATERDTHTATERDTHTAAERDRWLLRTGQALWLPAAVRARALLARSVVPLILLAWLEASSLLTLFSLSYLLNNGIVNFDQAEETLWINAENSLAFLLFLLSPVITVLLAIVHAVIVWRRGYLTRTINAALCAVFTIFAQPFLFRLLGIRLNPNVTPYVATDTLWWTLAVVLILLATFTGVGAIGAWALRRAITEIGSLGILAAKALPLLIVTLLFCFYNAEIWQVASRLGWGRTWALVAVLLGLTAALIVVVTTERVGDVRAETLTAHEAAALLADTPFADVPWTTKQPPQRLRERLNLVALPILTQLIQVLWFILLVTAFLLFLGWLSIPPAVVKTWTTQPLHNLIFFGATFSGWREYLQVALILAAFAGLSFAAAASVESAYKRSFTAPLLHEVRRSLAIQHAYWGCNNANTA